MFNYAGVNTTRPGRLHDLAMHPTVKPVVNADAIMTAAAARTSCWTHSPARHHHHRRRKTGRRAPWNDLNMSTLHSRWQEFFRTGGRPPRIRQNL